MRSAAPLLVGLLAMTALAAATTVPAEAPGRLQADDAPLRLAPDLPLVVDEAGDSMAGNLAFAAGRGLDLAGGALRGDGPLTWNGQPLGDVPAVLPGSGLQGGGPAGDLALAVDFSYAQRRVAAACPLNAAIRSIDASGGVACEADDGALGYAAGAGLALSGNVFSTNPAQTQNRVGGSCGPGASIRQVQQDGSVACEADDDSLQGIGCFQGGVVKRNATAWTCGGDVGVAYTEGPGIGIFGSELRVRFGGTGGSFGVRNESARSDHLHPGWYLAGFQRWTGSEDPVAAGELVTRRINCNEGTYVTGGGGNVTAGGPMFLVSSGPAGAGWEVQYYGFQAGAFRAYAICATY